MGFDGDDRLTFCFVSVSFCAFSAHGRWILFSFSVVAFSSFTLPYLLPFFLSSESYFSAFLYVALAFPLLLIRGAVDPLYSLYGSFFLSIYTIYLYIPSTPPDGL